MRYTALFVCFLVATLSGGCSTGDSKRKSDGTAQPIGPKPDISLLKSGIPMLISGASDLGEAINSPADWPPEAGDWNAKAVSYSGDTLKIVFETYKR